MHDVCLEMAGQICCIHYDTIKTSENLVKASTTALQTLEECKSIREGLGGDNHHPQQCSNIPHCEDLEVVDVYYHRKCYQKFTYAKALLKRKQSADEGKDLNVKVQRTARTSTQGENHSRRIFPDVCMICKKKSLKVSNKRQALTKIVTKTAENSLKAAAKVRGDEEMVILVSDTDLIAKEFQKHEKCYRDYTRVARECVAEARKEDDGAQGGNFDAVLDMIDQDILQGQQCISMETIMEQYKGESGTKQSRYKLKERLQKRYAEKLVFLQPSSHASLVVISNECLHGQVFSRNATMFKEFTVQKAAQILRKNILETIECAPIYRGLQPLRAYLQSRDNVLNSCVCF